MKQIHIQKTGNKGFTLVELMIAVVLTFIVSSVIYAMYDNQQRLHRQQEAVVDMQQNSRAAIYLIAQELRMAGFDSREVGGIGIQPGANSTNLRYTQDLNRDGDVDDLNEDITLTFNPPVLPDPGSITRDTGGGPQPFLNNVDFFEMVYTMEDGNTFLVPPAASLDQVQAVQISLLVRSSINEINFVNTLTFRSPPPFSTDVNGGAAFGDGFRRRMVSTDIQLRNASL